MPHLLKSTLPLKELQRIQQWHLTHRAEHPQECDLWDAVITVWLMGWVGCLLMVALEAWWAAPLCAVAMLSPRLYVDWRKRAHVRQQLRCDWLAAHY